MDPSASFNPISLAVIVGPGLNPRLLAAEIELSRNLWRLQRFTEKVTLLALTQLQEPCMSERGSHMVSLLVLPGSSLGSSGELSSASRVVF